jgi:signal transduction histidine kinase
MDSEPLSTPPMGFRFLISVQTRLADRLIPVQGDRVKLQQVVLNLILNAVEAMGSVEAGARALSISTEQDHIGVLVVVRDSGPGIDPATARPSATAPGRSTETGSRLRGRPDRPTDRANAIECQGEQWRGGR